MIDYSQGNITQIGLFDMQICVPASWTNEQILTFAETKYPCGTSYGWHIRTDEDYKNGLGKERVQCEKHPDKVHVMLDA